MNCKMKSCLFLLFLLSLSTSIYSSPVSDCINKCLSFEKIRSFFHSKNSRSTCAALCHNLDFCKTYPDLCSNLTHSIEEPIVDPPKTLLKASSNSMVVPSPLFASYVDTMRWWPPTSMAADLGVPGYAANTAYNVIILAFWLSTGPADVAAVWADPLKFFSTENPWGQTNDQIQKTLVAAYHSKGIKVLISAFGATEFPSSAGADPVVTCTKLAQWAKNNNLDGIDLDWEDTAAFTSRTGEDWLIKCTKAARVILPVGQYILSHAPQAPYFMGTNQYPNGGYLKVHKEVGNLIDFYNVQFYNQGSTTYESYESLFVKADGWSTTTSVKEIMDKGIPEKKIVVGKPAIKSDAANTGYVTAANLEAFITKAKNSGINWNGGVMTWQYANDKTGGFINTVSKDFIVSNSSNNSSNSTSNNSSNSTKPINNTSNSTAINNGSNSTKPINNSSNSTTINNGSNSTKPINNSNSSTPANDTNNNLNYSNAVHKVGVYFGNWKIYGRGYQLCNLPGDKVDRIFYGFWDPTSGECKFNDAWADLDKPGPADGICGHASQAWDAPLKGNVYQMLKIKERFPNLKVIASLGGWTYSKAFHQFISTDTARKTMAKSCGALIRQYSNVFDGLDVDLEYPCLPDDTSCGDGITPTSDDRSNFLALMKDFRAEIGTAKLLTIATTAVDSKIDALDLVNLNKILDSYNIMTYDFTSGSWGDTTTGHHTSPYKNPADPSAFRGTLSANSAAEYMASKGAIKSKINIGVAFYGRGFMIEKTVSPAPFVKALGGIEVGTFEKNNFDYYDLKKNYITASNVFWDDVAKAPYLFDKNKGYFITYDDARSIKEKVAIVKKNGYQGVFAWEVSGDTDSYELVSAMRTS